MGYDVALFTVEFLVRAAVLLHHVTRFKLRAILVGESHHHVDVTCNANLVEISEWSAAEWSETSSKDKTNIADDWIFNDFVLKALDSFVNETTAGEMGGSDDVACRNMSIRRRTYRDIIRS